MSKKKYPKSFYDDGLGDILDWIDDEVLVHSESKLLKTKEKSKSSKDISDKKTKKENKKANLYGDNEVSQEKYKAPKRARFELEDDEENSKVDKKLEDRARGLINRLAAQTMPFVTSEFEKLYSSNARSSVNAAIFSNIESSVINKLALTKRKLVAELMLLVSYLNYKISQDIGASLIHRLISRFEKLYTAEQKAKKTTDSSSEDQDKQLNNIISCLVNLYFIGLVSSNVIFDVTERICSGEFKSKSIELLLLVVKSVGFQLRKDDPSKMRKFIMTAQEKCKSLKLNPNINTRAEFMIDALGAIKNNNMSKIVNYGCDIDRDIIESTLKSLIKRTKLPEPLADASYEEILNSPNWYLMETRCDEAEDTSTNKMTQLKENTSTNEKKICKALGLNKPAERTIFTALLKVSDYVEASNIIIGFGLNHCSDAMLVCIHVATHQKKYNPFYFNLINNLCKFNRKYKMAAKFSIQDKIRALSQMTSQRVEMFKVLCFELVKSDAIPITILKSVEWADLSESTKTFLVYLLESISDLDDEEKRRIMSKVDKKSSFAGAMRTFTNCFLKGCRLFQ